jgi:hypothetical protein
MGQDISWKLMYVYSAGHELPHLTTVFTEAPLWTLPSPVPRNLVPTFIPSGPCIQTGSGAHPDSCTMGTGGPFPGGKARPGRDADHSPSSSAEVKNE